jgi:hypothetical protein
MEIQLPVEQSSPIHKIEQSVEPVKKSIYKGIPKPRYKTVEEKEKRRQEKLEYAKQYYQEHKKKMQKQNQEAWKKRRRFLCELGNDPRVLEFYENLKKNENSEN